MAEQKDFFTPLPERLMTAPKDREKPGVFLQLFPHPLSRLLIVLLWKINSVQDGDAVVLPNTWLRDFATISSNSLRKYRTFLHDSNVIHATALGNGREYLYRLVNRKGRPLADETNADAVVRLKDTKTITERIRQNVIRRYERKVSAAVEADKPASDTRSSWDMIEDDNPM
jgi:hypothetical protein